MGLNHFKLPTIKLGNHRNKCNSCQVFKSELFDQHKSRSG